MAYYNICPNCGSNLDPGETCDRERDNQPEEAERKGGEFFGGDITTAGRVLSRSEDRVVRVG